MNHNEPENDQDHPETMRRLQAFGSAPLGAELAGRTLERVRSGRRKVGGARLKLMSAAAIAGFAAGGVGLAAADVLPAAVQDAAHNTLATVGVHVPPGHNRYNDPTVCPGGPYANHGAYVRSHKDDPDAGKSPCGKPVKSVGPSGASKDDRADGATGEAGHGSPPSAHGDGKAKGKGNKDDNAADDAPDAPKAAKPSEPTTTPTTKGSASTSSTSTSPSTVGTTTTTMQS